jgi:ubiquinone/menaquinone biosynthesis C-methylase UbiE
MSHDMAPPQTAGKVLHAARFYDLFGNLMSLGRPRRIRERLVELAAPLPSESVLDVGCGTGRLALALKRRVGSGEVHGIDASPEMIAVATENVARAGADADVRIGLIEALPFHENNFELVTRSLMLHHLPDDLKTKGFAEIRRVLKPGGRFVAVDFARQGRSASGFGRTLGHVLSRPGVFAWGARDRQARPRAAGGRFHYRRNARYDLQELRLHPRVSSGMT